MTIEESKKKEKELEMVEKENIEELWKSVVDSEEITEEVMRKVLESIKLTTHGKNVYIGLKLNPEKEREYVEVKK